MIYDHIVNNHIGLVKRIIHACLFDLYNSLGQNLVLRGLTLYTSVFPICLAIQI